MVIDWSKVDKEDYLSAMERSPVRDTEIKHVLKQAPTDKINDSDVYTKGIDNSYHYEGYTSFRAENFRRMLYEKIRKIPHKCMENFKKVWKVPRF